MRMIFFVLLVASQYSISAQHFCSEISVYQVIWKSATDVTEGFCKILCLYVAQSERQTFTFAAPRAQSAIFILH